MSRVLTKFTHAPSESAIAAEEESEATAAAESTEIVAETPPPKPSKLYEWNGQGRKISQIIIDTDQQQARFYSGDEEIGWSTIASGLPKHPTPVGEFAVMEKIANKRSNLYGKVVKGGKVIHGSAKAGRDPIPPGARFEGAHMPYFMRLTYDGIGLHAGPIPRPGHPASHGCIRLPSTLAPVLFEHVPHGTPVKIVGQGPDYGNYMEKQRIAAARAAREAEQRRLEQEIAAAQASALGVTAELTTAPAILTPEHATASASTLVSTDQAEPARPAQTTPNTRLEAAEPPSPVGAPVIDRSLPGPSAPPADSPDTPAMEAAETPREDSASVTAQPHEGNPAPREQQPVSSAPAAPASTSLPITPVAAPAAPTAEATRAGQPSADPASPSPATADGDGQQSPPTVTAVTPAPRTPATSSEPPATTEPKQATPPPAQPPVPVTSASDTSTTPRAAAEPAQPLPATTTPQAPVTTTQPSTAAAPAEQSVSNAQQPLQGPATDTARSGG